MTFLFLPFLSQSMPRKIVLFGWVGKDGFCQKWLSEILVNIICVLKGGQDGYFRECYRFWQKVVFVF